MKRRLAAGTRFPEIESIRACMSVIMSDANVFSDIKAVLMSEWRVMQRIAMAAQAVIC